MVGRSMFGYLDFLFLSYSGRIGRMAYWLGLLVLVGIQLGVTLVLLRLSGGTQAQLTADPENLTTDVVMHVMMPFMIVTLIFLYPTYAITTKRWHDRGKSGWWSLIVLVPVIGGLWALIELGFLGGEETDNSYGANPAYG
jgi:uncharacterized membrane protein YhaH (DUF805 family)